MLDAAAAAAVTTEVLVPCCRYKRGQRDSDRGKSKRLTWCTPCAVRASPVNRDVVAERPGYGVESRHHVREVEIECLRDRIKVVNVDIEPLCADKLEMAYVLDAVKDCVVDDLSQERQGAHDHMGGRHQDARVVGLVDVDAEELGGEAEVDEVDAAGPRRDQSEGLGEAAVQDDANDVDVMAKDHRHKFDCERGRWS